MLASLALAGLVLLWSPVSSLGDLNHDLAARRATASQLRVAIAAETRRIQATGAGVSEARARLAELQGQVAAQQAKLARTRHKIEIARDQLTFLENRYHQSAGALAENLRASYEDQAPDIVTVVLNSQGFADALERLDFMEKVARHNATILGETKTARVQVLAQAVQLAQLEDRNRELTSALVQSRNAAAALEGALLTRQAAQLRERANTGARLSRVRGQIASIKHQIDQLSHPVTTVTTATGPNNSIPLDPGGLAQAPADAPAAVKQVIAAGNAIAGLPYLYGGGHGSFHANAYDCSGSVSYALAAAGLVSSPLDSTAFEGWGEPGPGRWITVYANAGHAFMVVAGWRFDTSAMGQTSTRWSHSMRGTGGFVARHPAGL